MTDHTIFYSHQTSPSSLFFIFNSPFSVSYPPARTVPGRDEKAIFVKKNITFLFFFILGSVWGLREGLLWRFGRREYGYAG
ncbi:hypothetical protein LQZ21_07780 [Treponema sp. TIM-1]|uniref:hypothetical protein n=1 Tax=Treponema sp. TIM-1 TaxID=2898417 RepID=UPI0039802F5B